MVIKSTLPSRGQPLADRTTGEDKRSASVSIHKIKLKSRGNPFPRKMSFPFSRPLCSCNFSSAKSLSSTALAPDLKAAPDMSVMVTKNLTAAAFENCRITVPSWLRSHFTCDCSSLRRNAAFFYWLILHWRGLYLLTLSAFYFYGLRPAKTSGFAAA
ncbi:hypothetical protein NGUA38_00065 [Salmonella enterica]|nr:hypothetical protein NGUA38_00065 [Salmonella enterica]